jgi:hypothetical protein
LFSYVIRLIPIATKSCRAEARLYKSWVFHTGFHSKEIEAQGFSLLHFAFRLAFAAHPFAVANNLLRGYFATDARGA